jgi:hypothetical protein
VEETILIEEKYPNAKDGYYDDNDSFLRKE